MGKNGGNYGDLVKNPRKPLTYGGDERIRFLYVAGLI